MSTSGHMEGLRSDLLECISQPPIHYADRNRDGPYLCASFLSLLHLAQALGSWLAMTFPKNVLASTYCWLQPLGFTRRSWEPWKDSGVKKFALRSNHSRVTVSLYLRHSCFCWAGRSSCSHRSPMPRGSCGSVLASLRNWTISSHPHFCQR